jgi:hypothetical protein
MKIEQLLYEKGAFIRNEKSQSPDGNGQVLVLGFGARELLADEDMYSRLKERYPAADIVLCSTSGEIYKDAVFDNTVSVIAMQLEKTRVLAKQVNIADFNNSNEAGQFLFTQLQQEDLSYILILSDGGLVNGSELVSGFDQMNTRKIPVTGGLAGDADRFLYTLTGCNGAPAKGNIVAIGFYGQHLKIGHGSVGGWDMFGPEKKVTRSVSNRLYEIENKNALELYKLYLGKYADELPGSALLFPLSVRMEDEPVNTLVRTILSVDPGDQAMVFAGDIPEGSYVRFMKANFDKLVDAATQAAAATFPLVSGEHAKPPALALLISCVGRKLILGKRIDEEVEAVTDTFGQNTFISGFYSYGEISPLNPAARCELHNQTMTITTFEEA